MAAVFYLSSVFGIPDSWGLIVLSLLCFGMTSALLYLIANRTWDAALSLIPSALWMTYIFALPIFSNGLESRLLSDVTFIPLFVLSFYLLYQLQSGSASNSNLNYIVLGALLGYLMLVRPIAMGLGIVYTFLLLWSHGRQSKRMLSRLLLLHLAALFVILPWELWVYQQSGKIIPLSVVGRHNAVDGLTSFAVSTKEYRQVASVPADVEQLMNRLLTQRADMESTPGLLRVLGQEFLKSPAAMTKLFVIKAGRSWYGTDSGRYENLTLALQLAYLALSVVSALLLFLLRPPRRFIVVSVLALVLYFWLMTLMVLPVLRYMIPAMSLLFLLTPAPISYFSRSRSAARSSVNLGNT